MGAVGFILIPHPEAAFRQGQHTGVNHPVGAKSQLGFEMPDQQIGTGIMKDLPFMAGPLGRHTLDVADIHMVQAFMEENLRRPEGITAPFEVKPLQNASVKPILPTVPGYGHTQIRAVDPSHTSPFGGSPAVGVNHPPFLQLPVPDDHRIGGPVINRIAEQRSFHSCVTLLQAHSPISNRLRKSFMAL
ncbi:hypothetical protein D3C75_826180 [compost metagenome]